MTDDRFDPGAEFDRQLDHLVRLGYPALAGRAEEAFRTLLSPLRDAAVAGAVGLAAPTDARAPFLLVTTRS